MKRHAPIAIPGADGYVPDQDDDPAATGSISKTPEKADQSKAGGEQADAKKVVVPKRHHRRIDVAPRRRHTCDGTHAALLIAAQIRGRVPLSRGRGLRARSSSRTSQGQISGMPR